MTRAKRSAVRPRWTKVLADLWDNKMRTLLAVLSIAAGVFAIGTIGNAGAILNQDMGVSYASVNPANITIVTEPFGDDFLRSVRGIPGVAGAEGRHHLHVSVIRPGLPPAPLELIAIRDMAMSRINLLEFSEGRHIPGEHELVVEDDIITNPGYPTGSVLTLELADGSRRQVRVAGYVVDRSAGLQPGATARGYVHHDALEWLGAGTHYDRLVVTVSGDDNDLVRIEAVSATIEEKIAESGRQVFRVQTAQSGVHPRNDMLLTVFGILSALGLLVTLLSTSLIFNTLNSLLAQNLRQIGVMKLVGARSGQVLGMYLVLILLFGLLALAVAAPAGAVAGYQLASFLAEMMNSALRGFRVIPTTVVIQLVLAILVSLAAGMMPVVRGARTKVRRALSDTHTRDQPTAGGLWQRLSTGLQWLGRPVVLSLRNTFRRKGRLVLTLFTLIVAGGTFVAVFNVRVSMLGYIEEMMQHFNADLTLTLERPYRASAVEQAALEVPGIAAIEGWSGGSGEVVDSLGNVLENVQVSAPPAGSSLIDLALTEGRWLLPGDDKAIVISDAIKITHPGIGPGDTLRMSLSGGPEEEWTIVGMFSFPPMLGDSLAYVPLESLSGAGHAPSHIAAYRLNTSDPREQAQARIGATLDQHLRTRGFKVASVQTGAELRGASTQSIGVLVTLLLLMALLTAVVGSIGLTGTMSMNVMDRTREIGVMRAIGAVDAAVMKSVVIEGALIGLLSWAIALPLSFPISSLLLGIITTSMGIAGIEAAFTMRGMAIWLAVVVVLTALASLWPARNAVRLTIREVLAYE
jgi:putative ABC transport system permease protein